MDYEISYIRKIITMVLFIALFVSMALFIPKIFVMSSEKYVNDVNGAIDKYINEKPATTVTIPKEDVIVTYTPND